MINKSFNGLQVPALGFGTYTLTKEPIQQAINVGFRHLDTARNYGNENDVGEAWKKSGIPRNEFFITTKIWHDRLKPEQVTSEVEESLKSLKTDYIDLLLIHWPSSENVALEDTLEAFNRAKEEGKARAIGVSNFTAELQQKAMNITKIHCNQVEYHPFLDQGELIDLCTENNIALTAYRPLAKNEVSNNEVIKEIAEKHNKSTVQVTLRWLLQQEPILAIPRTKNEKHMQGNLEIFDFELTKEDMQAIFSLEKGMRQLNPAFGPWKK